MSDKYGLKPIIGIICVVVVLLTAVVAVILDSQSPDPILGIFQTEPTEESQHPTEQVITEETKESETQAVSKETEAATNTTTEATTEATTEETQLSTQDPQPENPQLPTEESQGPTEESQVPTEDSQGTTEETVTSTEETQEATEKSTDPTEDTKAPTEADPTEDKQDPTEESKNPTEDTQAPTEDTKVPTESTPDPTEDTKPSDEVLTPPEDQPPSVTIPPEKDPETGEEIGISFPCQVPGYQLTIEKLAPYAGMFVEDGTNVNTENVAMLLVSNDGDSPIEYTQIRVTCGEEELLFDISALPAGEKLVVQEKTGKTLSDGYATSASALVVQRASMEMSEGTVKVIENGDNTLTIQNLTNKTIPTVRIFYKYYMEAEDVFVGGIAFTVRLSRLGAGASITIQPSHYTSQTSRVVMVLTYDSEV